MGLGVGKGLDGGVGRGWVGGGERGWMVGWVGVGLGVGKEVGWEGLRLQEKVPDE